MAETTPTPANIPAIAHLEGALAHPEPMCLAILEIHQLAGGGSESAVGESPRSIATPEAWIMDEAHRRLRDTLRDYDELTVLDSHRFVLVLRTLADASVLGRRMTSLYAIMAAPYIGRPAAGQNIGRPAAGQNIGPPAAGQMGEGTATAAARAAEVIVGVEVYLGAAVRIPQETSGELVSRVDQAVILARSSTSPGPVLL